MTTIHTIKLPAPRADSTVSLEHTLQQRRSVREFSSQAISLTDLSQLLWAAQGITHGYGFRTAPSAGALYPLELYVVAGNVDGLTGGVYRFHTKEHQLIKHLDSDLRQQVSHNALNQDWMDQAAVILVFTAIDKRTTRKYGERGIRYVHIEVGHAAQNVFLQAVALQLGAAVVGAFDDQALQKLLDLPEHERVLYLMPVGKP